MPPNATLVGGKLVISNCQDGGGQAGTEQHASFEIGVPSDRFGISSGLDKSDMAAMWWDPACRPSSNHIWSLLILQAVLQ